jgi:hypothetical protein
MHPNDEVVLPGIMRQILKGQHGEGVNRRCVASACKTVAQMTDIQRESDRGDRQQADGAANP